MWQMIGLAASVTLFLRIAPAFFKNISRLQEYPRFTKFLDYTICLISSEVIYTVAFRDIPQDANFIMMFGLSLSTLMIAATMMWFTSSLAKSFSTAIIFFIVGYSLLPFLTNSFYNNVVLK